MCCQFYVDDETKRHLQALVNQNITVPMGEMHPSDFAAVIFGGKHLCAESMRWGFQSPVNKGLIINSRAKTADEKPLFSDSYERRRCVIPAARFYEWDRKKQKVTFKIPGRNVLYMAGIYRRELDKNHFAVLTIEANDDMSPIHDRMPLLLQTEDIESWLNNRKAADELRKMRGPRLQSSREFEQLSLF